MLLFTLNLQAGAAPEPVASTGYSKPLKRKRYYAEIGGMRFLFPTEQARDRALAAENPKEVAAEVIKKAAVTSKPVAKVVEPVPEVIEPAWDDEEDIEMLLMAI